MARVRSRTHLGDVVLHGLLGHPLHPPLTDATIGMLVFATALAVLGAAMLVLLSAAGVGS